MSRKTGSGTRVHFGVGYGFYDLNSNHTKYNYSIPGVVVGIRREVHADRQFKTYIGFGADYFVHGVSFNSYYFSQDSVKVYDKSKMYYNYYLVMHELHLPLQIKFLFKQANNSLFSPYVSLEYHLRYLLPANLQILYKGKSIKQDTPDMFFRNSNLGDKLSSFVSVGFGWQKNNLASSRHSFFMEVNFRYGFAQYYFQEPYAANSLFTNASHVCVMVGYKI